MIHIFFSVHLTIYRSAKSQPSSLRLELIICSISDLSGTEKSLLSHSLISLSTKHPNTRQSHCSFWPDIQGKLKKYSNKSTYLFEMDTVENNFYSKTWIYISIQYIFKHDLDMLQGKFKLVKTLVLFFFVYSEMLQWQQINWSHSLYQKSLSSTKLTDNVTSTEKDIQLYEWSEYLKLTQHIIIYMVWKSYEYYLKIYNGYINVVK